jgi:hypothetical protein
MNLPKEDRPDLRELRRLDKKIEPLGFAPGTMDKLAETMSWKRELTKQEIATQFEEF